MITNNYQRPPLTEYQREIIDHPARYTITEASTKVGKTVSHIIWLFEQTLRLKEGQNNWWIAPVYSQTEIAYSRLKQFITDKSIFQVNDSKLRMTLANGAHLWFKSGEKPDNLYGEDVHNAVLDEYTRMREQAWYAIRSTLTATNGKCKMIGNVVDTINWGWCLARDVEAGKKGDDWKHFKLTIMDAVRAGIVTQAEVEDAKNTLPESVFLQLYYGIPDESGSNKFCYSFKESEHVGSCKINPDYPVILSFDFNYNPISCGIFQNYNETIYCPEMVKLENSNIYQLCDLLRTKLEGCILLVTGDATGRANSALVKDTLNYYSIIKQHLPVSKFNVPSVNPKMEDNQVLVNAIFEHYKVQIDPDKAQSLIFDCKFVAMDNEGKIIKTDRSDPKQQADALDCFTGDTLILSEYGYKRIDEIMLGERVLTRNGYQKVIDKWDSVSEVYEVVFTDGKIIKCTQAHKFYTYNSGFIEILRIFEKNIELCQLSYTKEYDIQSIQSRNTIIAPKAKSSIQDRYTGKCGMMNTEKYQKATTSTTKTKTPKTTQLAISNLWMALNTLGCTLTQELRKTLIALNGLLKLAGNMLKSGMEVNRAYNGIENMLKALALDIKPMENENVSYAMGCSPLKIVHNGSVPTTVNPNTEGIPEKTKKTEHVLFAEMFSTVIDSENKRLALGNVEVKCTQIRTMRKIGQRKVYDITVENEHEFFANGVLAHNCLRYYENAFHKQHMKIPII